MEIKLNRTDLTRGIKAVQGLSPTRSTLPVLGCVLLDCEKATATVACTNLEQYAMAPLAYGEGFAPVPGFKCAISVKRLASMVANLPADDVYMKLVKDRMHIRSGACNFILPVLPGDEFPEWHIDAVKQENLLATVTVDGAEFAAACKAVATAASVDATRVVMTGLLMACAGQEMVLSATDGKRVHRMTIPAVINTGTAEDCVAVVPPMFYRHITAVAGCKTGTNLQLQITAAGIGMKDDGGFLWSKQIDGQFPNINQVFPPSYKSQATIPVNMLRSAIQRVALIAELDTPMTLSLRQDELQLNAVHTDNGEASDSLPIEYRGEPIEFAFRASFFLDSLACFDGNEVCMKWNDAVSPVGMMQDSVYNVVMPMRV